MDTKSQNAKLASLSQRFKPSNVSMSFGSSPAVRNACVVLENCTTVYIQITEAEFTTDWLNAQVVRACREVGRDTNSNLLSRDFLCLESACRNFLTDWQLSQPNTVVRFWQPDILLRPVYRGKENFDGTISDKLFQRSKILGTGGFSKVFMGRVL